MTPVTSTFVALLVAAGGADSTPASPTRPVSRDEVLRLASERNLELLVQRLEVDRLGTNATAQSITFAPVLIFDTAYTDNPRRPPAVPGDVTRRPRGIEIGGGIAWSSPVGTGVTLRADNDFAIDGDPTLAQHTELSLTLSQRLLRGGWLSGARADVELAELAALSQRERFRDQLNDLLALVESAYWELAFRQADLKIKTRSRDRAQAQFEDTKTNIDNGLIAPGEIYVVEDNVVFFEQQRLRGEENLLLAQRRLAELLQLAPDEALIAADDLAVTFGLPTRDATIDTGLRRNGEITAGRIELQRAEVQLAYDRNQTLPSLDLSATFALNGLDRDAGEAWRETVSFTQPEARVGLNFSIPLDYGPNFARIDTAETTKKQRVLRLKSTEQRVRFEIENLIVRLDKQLQRLSLADRQVRLSGLKLDTEQEKYKNGITTLLDVVRFQRDLDGALINYRRAQVDLLSNRARLAGAMGTLHEERGIKLESP